MAAAADEYKRKGEGRGNSYNPPNKTPAGPEDPIKRDSKGVPTSVNKNRISDEKLQRFTDVFAKSDRGPRAKEIKENLSLIHIPSQGDRTDLRWPSYA